MISNQILQKTLDGLHQISKMDFAIFDENGNMLVTTFSEAKKFGEIADDFAKGDKDSDTKEGGYFYKVYEDGVCEYVIMVNGNTKEHDTMGRIACFQLNELAVAYRERFDKDNFIKNLLLDNLLLVDIYNRAKKLHIDAEARRVVMVVEIEGEKIGDELERVRAVFGQKSMDFVTAVDEKNVIVIKEIGIDGGYENVDKSAKMIISTLSDRKGIKVRVAYGTVINEIKDVSRSYKEAIMALDVGKIFFTDRDIIAYSVLGIGRLIYQLPIPLCRMFIKEIFGNQTPDQFDEDTLGTINKFFENSLNVSETSRQLYIHRNTLVYRLDKLQKATGLDLRVFEDAITFKIALMVVEYMKYMDDQNF